MTIEEYREALGGLSDEKFYKFNDNLGGGQKTREERIRDYADKPESERRICYLLNLKTEDEKMVESARRSARAAALSALIAFFACLASIAAAIVAYYNLK